MDAKKKTNIHQNPFEKEERSFLTSFERSEWEIVKNLKKEIAIAKKAAANYLKKKNRTKD